MKLLCGFLLIVLAVTDVWSLPARNSPQDDAEVIDVPHARPESGNTDFRDFVDTGAVHPFLQPSPSTFHFPSFSFDDIFRRLRPRFWPILVDSSEAGSGDGDSSDAEPTLGFGLRLPTALNTKNGNTTSTVKVVDGHKVEINETTYGDSNSLFKVRLVNVRPLESGEEIAQGVTNSEGEFKPLSAPSTSAPPKRTQLPEESEEDETDRREPLEKQSKDNEVRDIDEPQV
ncbi:icarapin-like [Drosophila grimshawi]|uniref:GH10136 n=1 Tax=Drosophila grimshawi TaxID=7222 RepID=B4JCC6_DROGR|nr:icarapin-like [Drosophila grimshawi]XP_032591809.1 icarapin-like [Drosophila grimshawi]XP_043070413.1 icarapin-like [Drosophila grimshawi]XP_043070414.1 icarapin-like [Drosophila grimshawi]EDW04159.1 GH10136 [Drosophila grimshawi]